MAGFLKAIRLNNVEVVEKKLKKGHDPNKHKEELDISKKIKCTTIPLCLAAAKGYTQIVSKLIEYGADIHATNSDWSTPMHLATFNGHADTMRVLIVNDVCMDTKDTHGNTALHVAAKKSNYECVKLLFKNGADANATNASGKTPLDVSRDDDIVDLLLNAYSSDPQLGRLGSLGSASDDDFVPTSRVPGYRESLLFIEDSDFSAPYITNTSESKEKEALLRQLQAIEREEVNKELRQKETHLVAVEDVISQTYDDVAAAKTKMKALEDRLQLCKQVLQEHEEQRAQLKKDIVMLELKRNGTCVETKDTSSTPNESYECPICLEVPLPPVQVFQCTNGHIYCGRCRTQPTMKRCPECRVSIKKTAIRNICLEEIIRKHYNST